MQGKFLHKIGALILTVGMLSGVAVLGSSTAQARHRRVVVVPEVRIGRPYHRHWHHWRYRGW